MSGVSYIHKLIQGTMKVLVGFLALIAIALASADVLAASNEVESHQRPYTLKFSLTNKDQEVFNNEEPLEKILGRSLVANSIENALEDFRNNVVINGDPPLDPYVVDKIGPFEVDISGVRTTTYINNLRVEGLRWFVVDYVTFNPIRLTLGLQLTVPWLTVTGLYDAEAKLSFLVLHRAGGNFRVFINRLEIAVDVSLGTNLIGGHLTLRGLDIRLHIADTLVRIDGMTGSSLLNALISSYVQNLTQETIQNHLEQVSKTISEQIFDVVNDILKDYTLADILG